MKTRIGRFTMLSCLFVLAALVQLVQLPVAQADSWYWLSSDSKYSKFFDPTSVYTEESAKTSHGNVPIAIRAWTRTNYSYGGAQETLAAYKLTKLIPDATQLSYSYAQGLINPQNRTLQYLEEAFYDAKGTRLWHTTAPGRLKEINSQEFDEAFYTAIVDETFRTEQETERAKAKDRWLSLWEEATLDGHRTSVMVDTSTLRLRDKNVIGWFWQETKDSNGAVLEIKFLKRAINLPQGSEKVVSGKYWSAKTGWQPMRDMDGIYRAIRTGTAKYTGLQALRNYAKTHQDWLTRYQISK